MSGYYAAEGQIARDPIEGGIEITREQYKAALEAVSEGRLIAIREGAFALIDPPEPEPQAEVPREQEMIFPPLTPRQLRLMLLTLGLTEATVLGQIEAIEDETERAAALIEWNWATRYDRDHPLVAQLASALEFDPGELDVLWTYAADL